jgi:pimeloyl-ACP methyl ester carboxylesterase
MLRRHALAAISLGGIATVAACRDSFALAPPDDAQPDLERVPGEAKQDEMQHHFVTGGGGCRLHVIDTGNAKGQPILFIHGFSQNALTWSAQLSSGLRRRYRLLAVDLRGHGASDKPATGYDNSKLWADDIDAIIRELSLDHPILSGWSYGPLVMLDYVRYYGESQIGGLHFVDGMTKLGSPEALSVLTPEVLALVPGFFSTDTETSVSALGSPLRLCFLHPLSAAAFYTMLGFTVSVPAFVRQALFGRTIDNDDLLPTLRKPLLITHGAADAVVKVEVVEQIHGLVPHAEIQLVPNAGHGPFRDDVASFNGRLSAFADGIRHSNPTSGV